MTTPPTDRIAFVLGRFGVAAVPFLEDEQGNPGVVVRTRDGTDIYTTSASQIADPFDALDWAQVVATIALGVKA